MHIKRNAIKTIRQLSARRRAFVNLSGNNVSDGVLENKQFYLQRITVYILHLFQVVRTTVVSAILIWGNQILNIIYFDWMTRQSAALSSHNKHAILPEFEGNGERSFLTLGSFCLLFHIHRRDNISRYSVPGKSLYEINKKKPFCVHLLMYRFPFQI